MNQSVAKKIRKEIRVKKNKVANQLVLELLSAPFKYRLKFALKLLIGVRKGKVVA